MTVPIALQLYTLRDSLANDFEGTIRRVAALGYAGVEPYNFSGTTPQAAAHLFRELGLQVCSVHRPLPLGEAKNQILDEMELLNCRYLVCAHIPADELNTVDRVKQACDRLNQADEVARENGLTFFYHNHWWEYRDQINGRRVSQLMLDHLVPTVKLEVDTYWVKTGGYDPATLLRDLGTRAPLLHLKDGPADEKQPMVAVGEGSMDWPTVMAASRAEWLIVELDRCATDIMEAVAKSYIYLVGKGYARGSKT
jgi:sugar phosphate isomerase/epimerase